MLLALYQMSPEGFKKNRIRFLKKEDLFWILISTFFPFGYRWRQKSFPKKPVPENKFQIGIILISSFFTRYCNRGLNKLSF